MALLCLPEWGRLIVIRYWRLECMVGVNSYISALF